MNTGTTIRKLAVLIDADNAMASVAEALLHEVAKYGTAQVKRAYGNWDSPRLKGWKEQLLPNSIQPIQQYDYTKGKNASDSAIIIDAMDLLYSARFDGFCIVSSDSDFTPLAMRIRASGLTVYGFGERKTPDPFVRACDKFIFTEVLLPESTPGTDESNEPPRRRTAQELKQDTRLLNLLRAAIEDAEDDNGWASLGEVGSIISKRSPDFDARNYGYAKLSGLIGAIGLFETEERQSGNARHIFLRDKKKSPPRE